MNPSVERAGTIDTRLLESLHHFIHGWFPHSSALIDALSTAVVIVAAVIVAIHGKMSHAERPLERAVRVGFAAAPVPVFLVLPFVPYDTDLAAMLAEERLLLALAAATGLLWTVREIRNAFAE